MACHRSSDRPAGRDTARAVRRWTGSWSMPMLLALVLACSAGCRDPGTERATALASGDVLEAGSVYPSALPDPADPHWKPVTLPDNWDGRRPGFQGYVWYRLRYADQLEPGLRRALYLPTASMNAEIVLNGIRLGSFGRMEMPTTRHFYTPLLFELPQRLPVTMAAGPNELLVLLAGYAGYHSGLGVAYFGRFDDLYGAWRWRAFWQNTGTLATSVFNIALGIYALLLWWGERRSATQHALGWFGAALVVWGLRNLNLVVTEPVLPDLLWALITVAGAATFIGLFSLFAIRLAEHEDRDYRAPRWLPPAIKVYIVVALVFFLSSPGYRPANIGFAPIAVLGVLMALWTVWRLVRLAWRRRTPPLVAVAVAAVIYGALLMRDYRIATDESSLGDMFLRQYAAVPLFVAIALLLRRRYFAALAQAQELSASLQSQVAAQRQELQHHFDRLREVERDRALTQERARLTRDLHDSLGMHLVSALRQVRGSLGGGAGDGGVGSGSQRLPGTNVGMSGGATGSATRGATDEAMGNSTASATGYLTGSAAALAGTLQDCLDDLRVVIDACDTDERDALVALGTLRFRLAPRFEAIGMRLDWRIETANVDPPPLEPGSTLELLRIVQEALTNALKHSGGHVVTLAVEASPAALVVSVSDDGRGLPAEACEGRGLGNMRTRAQRIGARWSLQQAATGCTVRIELPWSPPAGHRPALQDD